MCLKKVGYPFFVFGTIACLLISFISISTCFSAQNFVQCVDLPTSGYQTLPCVWINGKTLLSIPPEPLNSLQIALNLKTKKSSFLTLQPLAFDPFYIDRIVSKDVLMNTFFLYSEEKSSKKTWFLNKVYDQLSMDEFLYFTHDVGTSENQTFTSFFLVNPYRKQSKLIYSENDKDANKHLTYAGYLANTNQYCFISGKRLLLYSPETREVVNETFFPTIGSSFKTDGHSRFLFVDAELNMYAYSVQKHSMDWINKESLEYWYSGNNFHFRTVSFSNEWFLATDDSKQKFISPIDGRILAYYDLQLTTDDFPASFQEVGQTLWFHYFNKQGYSEPIFNLKFEKLIYSKEKGISATLYQLDNPVVDKNNQVSFNKLIPIGYSFLPRYNKVLIIFKDLEDLETQAIFDLP